MKGRGIRANEGKGGLRVVKEKRRNAEGMKR